MKKCLLVLLVLFLAVPAFSQKGGITIQTVRVGMELRMLHIYTSEKGLHHVYFTEPGSGKSPIFLGEEIFKKGEKIFDNYKEND